MQITVGAIFAVLTLLLLMAAIWIAILSATNLVKPITRLVQAAQRLGGGDLAARVKTGRRDDELGELSRTFNTMALQPADTAGTSLSAPTSSSTIAAGSPNWCCPACPPG